MTSALWPLYAIPNNCQSSWAFLNILLRVELPYYIKSWWTAKPFPSVASAHTPPPGTQRIQFLHILAALLMGVQWYLIVMSSFSLPDRVSPFSPECFGTQAWGGPISVSQALGLQVPTLGFTKFWCASFFVPSLLPHASWPEMAQAIWISIQGLCHFSPGFALMIFKNSLTTPGCYDLIIYTLWKYFHSFFMFVFHCPDNVLWVT